MNRPTLTTFLVRLVLLSLFVFASCGATLMWTTINGTCPSSCLCSVDNYSSLAVGNCSRENIDRKQLSEQIDSLLSSNLTYRYLTHGRLEGFGIINTPLVHVPRSVCRLTTLQELLLYNTSLPRLPDNCLSNLAALTIALSRITKLQHRVFDGLHKLERLILSSNNITELQDGIFNGLRMLEYLLLDDNRISSIGSRVFGGSAMTNSLSYVNLSHNRIRTLDSWPICIGINRTVKIELRDNNISRFTNTLRWKENCGMRNVHFDLLLERNPIMMTIPDLLRGWDMNISSTWCTTGPTLTLYSLSINYVYLDCDCVDFIIFTLRLSLNRYNTPVGRRIYSRPLILNQCNAVPLDQFVCELTERCPSGCRCVHRPANATLHIYCSNTNLTVLPLELPELPKSYTKYKLDFSNLSLIHI